MYYKRVACFGAVKQDKLIACSCVYECALAPRFSSFFPFIHSSVRSFIHSLNSFHFRFVLITKFQHDCMTVWQTRRSILQPTKSSFDLTFYKCARKLCTEFASFFTVGFLTFSFSFRFRSAAFFPFLSISNWWITDSSIFVPLEKNVCCKILWITHDVKHNSVWFCLLSTFLRWRIQFVDFCCFCLSFHCSFHRSMDSSKESLNQHDEQLFIPIIHVVLQFCHIIKSPKGGQCFFFDATARKEAVHSHQFALLLSRQLDCSFVWNRTYIFVGPNEEALIWYWALNFFHTIISFLKIRRIQLASSQRTQFWLNECVRG